MQYILRDGVPVHEPDIAKFSQWFQDHTDERILARDELTPDGGVTVSTVFLGFNHQFGRGNPILWETLVFATGMPFDGEMERYETREEALEGHKAMVNHIGARLSEGVTLDVGALLEAAHLLVNGKS